MNKKREFIEMGFGFVGALLMLYGLILFNQYLLMKLPLGFRMVSMVLSYWLVAVVPIIIMHICKDKLSDYGFTNKNILRQIIAGILIGMAFSFVFILLPHFCGLGNFVDNGKRYTYLWQFFYEFFYCIFAVGLVEEFIFRGFLYAKIKRACNDNGAVIISSILFGLFHLFAGNVIQMIATALLGIIWCMCKNKIKYCSTLSLIIAHGIYDALIAVFASVLI